MLLFGPRLSEEQKADLNSVTGEMNRLGSLHSQSFDAMAEQLRELYLACLSARRARLGHFTVADGTILSGTRAHLEQQRSHIDHFRGELQQIQIRDWFPRKLRKCHDEWLRYLDAEWKSLGTVMEAITAPEPLVDRPGAAKLNMFVSGLDIAAMMAKPLRSQVKP